MPCSKDAQQVFQELAHPEQTMCLRAGQQQVHPHGAQPFETSEEAPREHRPKMGHSLPG